VFGDLAVSQAAAGAADVEPGVDDLTGRNQNGVLPNEVGFGQVSPVACEEPTRAVDVEEVLHLKITVR